MLFLPLPFRDLERFDDGEEDDDDHKSGRDEAEGAEEGGFFGVFSVDEIFSVLGEHAVEA